MHTWFLAAVFLNDFWSFLATWLYSFAFTSAVAMLGIHFWNFWPRSKAGDSLGGCFLPSAPVLSKGSTSKPAKTTGAAVAFGDRCQKKNIFGSKKNYSRIKKKLSRIKKKIKPSTERKESSVLWSSGPLVPWSSGPLVLWSPEPLVLWSSGPLVLYSSRPLVLWSSGPLVLWSPGPLVLWSPGPLVLWSSGLWSSGPLPAPHLSSNQLYITTTIVVFACTTSKTQHYHTEGNTSLPRIAPRHICTSITLWKATIPCLASLNAIAFSNLHLHQHYSAKSHHRLLPRFQIYICTSAKTTAAYFLPM